MTTDDTFRQKTLTDAQRKILLDRLDEQDAAARLRDKRTNTRLVYRRTGVQLKITQPGGGTIECVVATRNLSSTGISFLYWGFLHVGTEVRVQLKRRVGGIDSYDGRVVWCRHVVGPHHVVGLRFTQKVFAKLYVDPSECEALDGDHSVDPKTLKGKLLCIDDQEMDRKLLQHHLRSTQIELVHAATADEAIAAVKKTPFDLVLFDLNLSGTKPDAVFNNLRSAGYAKPVLIVTAESSPQRLAIAHQSGAAAVVQKPYDPAKLISVLSLWLGGSGVTGEDAIFSEMPNADGMGALIEQYVENVRRQLVTLQKAMREEQIDTVRTVCQSLKGSGTGFGFPTVSEAAKEAVKTLDASMSISESATELQRLESLCRRVAVKPTPA